MRFGGFVVDKWDSPEDWANKAVELGYTGVYFPVDYTADVKEIDGYVSAAKSHNLVISEIGVWNNTIDKDLIKRTKNIDRAVKQLQLADYVGAKCCVNISGSCGDQWDGPHEDNFTEKTFDRIVETTQLIIDSASVKNTFYTLEPMPWMYPDSADSYLALIKKVDRKAFAAHLDPVNIISSPRLFYKNGDVIKEWFEKLGPYIKCCHAKDITLGGNLTVHLDECRPGLGQLDYVTYLKCMETIEDDVCLMLEHMSEAEDFKLGAEYVKSVAASCGIKI